METKNNRGARRNGKREYKKAGGSIIHDGNGNSDHDFKNQNLTRDEFYELCDLYYATSEKCKEKQRSVPAFAIIDNIFYVREPGGSWSDQFGGKYHLNLRK